MKKVLIILFCSLMLCSCSNSGKNVSLTAMSDDVVTLSVGFVQVPKSEIPSYFNLSEADFDACAVFVSLSGENQCGGCRVDMPMSLVSKLSDKGYIECENCHRIIYKSE